MLEQLKRIDFIDPLLRPGNYFETERDFFQSALKTLGVFLGVGTLLLFITTAVNIKELEMFNMAIQNQSPVPQSDWQRGFQNAMPWNRLTFPIFWFVAIFTTGAMRHLFLMVLGENRRDLGVTQAVTIFGVLPMLCLLVLTGIIGNLSPTIPRPGAEYPLGTEFWLMLLLGPVCLIWDGFVCLRGFRATYGQNTGRAALTWLAPTFMYGMLLFTLFVISIVWSIMSVTTTTA